MTSKRPSDDAAVEFLSELAVGVVTCRLYSPDHPRAQRARQRIAGRCEQLLAARSGAEGRGAAPASLDLAVVEDELFLGDRTFTRVGEEMPVLVRAMHRHAVDQVSFESGVTRDEIEEFVSFLAGPLRPSPPHLGHVRIRRPVVVEEEGEEAGEGEVGDLQLEQRLQVVANLVSAVTAGSTPPMALAYAMVRQLDERLQRASNPLRYMAEVADDRHWPIVHAHNTAVLTLALAIPLVRDSAGRQDLGVAALLHDAGKFGMPSEVLQHDLELSGLEWELNYDHPRIGLERLLAMPQAPEVARVVAFDHHLTQTGGGYPSLPDPRPPHPAAAMVAVAEVTDIMYSVRLAREQIAADDLGATLRECAGTVFDPLFARTMATIWDITR